MVHDTQRGLTIVTLATTPLDAWGIHGLTIPSDYVSDGMSVPRVLWGIIGARIGSKTLGPSVAHDYLYQTHYLPKTKADAWYRRALIGNGYSKILAWLVWLGVSLGGWLRW